MGQRAGMSPDHRNAVEMSESGKSGPEMTYGLLLLSALALLPASCGPEYVGLSQARAIEAAKAYVVREDYGGDEPLFYRNTGNRPAAVRRTRDPGGRRAWLVRFDDFQAMGKHCVTVRRTSVHVLAQGTAC